MPIGIRDRQWILIQWSEYLYDFRSRSAAIVWDHYHISGDLLVKPKLENRRMVQRTVADQ